jgi:hypothetical protein
MIVEVLFESLKLVLIVTVLMTLVEYLELRFQNRIRNELAKNPINQYLVASALGVIPGCIDAFLIVSMYSHGMVSFGALVSVMLATAGDEAFVMLPLIPRETVLISAVCFFLGIIGGFSADRIIEKINLQTDTLCEIEFHATELKLQHFLRDHVYSHILKRHVPRLFLWLFSTIMAIHLILEYWNLGSFIATIPRFWLLLIAALIGMIPESGPHLIFLFLYTEGLIPLSVLLVNTLSQDGHGLLPLIAHSMKDTVYVQIFTTIFSLLVGLTFFALGF